LVVELVKAKSSALPVVIVIDTDPWPSTEAGGSWWEVGVPEVSTRAEVNAAREALVAAKTKQWSGD
jgi:3D-(3,5/4)-trihydroxycyclohexane-1,2-dione acylhydrolase (decyclizing)